MAAIRAFPAQNHSFSGNCNCSIKELRRFKAAFSEIVDEWHPKMRYEVNRITPARARDFCDLVKDVYRMLKELKNDSD